MGEGGFPGELVGARIVPEEDVSGAQGGGEGVDAEVIEGHAGGAADQGGLARAGPGLERGQAVVFPGGDHGMQGTAAIGDDGAQATAFLDIEDAQGEDGGGGSEPAAMFHPDFAKGGRGLKRFADQGAQG